MPYVKSDDRARLDTFLPRLSPDYRNGPRSAGELNYMFTVLSLRYIHHYGQRYENFNDVLGALEATKLELYRRMVSPYEDEKIKDNGDVY